MLPLIIILLVAFIVVPLIDLILNERIKFGAKLVVYSLAFVYVIWLTYFVRV